MLLLNLRTKKNLSETMFLVDTNIFLEILLEQNNSEECEKFLEWSYKNGIPLACTHFSIHAIEAMLSIRNKFQEIEDFLQNLENMPNLQVYATTIEEEKQIIKIARKIKLDFDDALQYFVAKKTGASNIVSFDSHFDKTSIKRKTPKEFF